MRAPRAGYSAPRTRTATRTDTPLLDVPQAATVLTKSFIADRAIERLSQAMQFVPGITMASGEGHQDAPVIRGNSTTADFFVDGVRDDGLLVRDTYNVERVEAIKGANAMIFGRGGAGGVINRVTKEAGFAPIANLDVEAGSFGHRRTALDAGQSFGQWAAFRVNAMAENAGGFRDFARNTRVGLNPTTTLLLGKTIIRAGYEHLLDDRRVDRGIPSASGAPSSAPVARFFGDPDQSHSHALADAASVIAERPIGALELRNHIHWATYDKFYQNVFPSTALSADGSTLSLGAYNHRQRRDNIINQTDLTITPTLLGMSHTLLGGIELSHQRSTDFRNTGYFNGTATSMTVPFASPTVQAPITFRPSATDNDNNSYANTGAVYVQDQVTLSPAWQAVAGVRVESFDMHYHNNRTSTDLSRSDRLVSPRVGVIFKPAAELSLYGTASVSHLPSSGDQFSSLTVTTQTLEPEHFHNLEIGAKWDVRSTLSLTAAAYRLDRTNSQAPDPTTPGRIVQTGARRTNGVELGASGELTSKLSIVAGYSLQDARITGNTTAAPAGATVQLVPHHTASLWTRYQLIDALGIGAGVVNQAKSYAAIDNAVTLPAFTRFDAGVFARIHGNVRAQLNIENVLNARYYPTSQGNNNIVPGAPRTALVSLRVGI